MQLISPTAPTREDALTASLAFIESLVARGGPESAEFPALDGMMNLLPALAPAELGQLRAAFGDALSNLDTMQAFAWLKPHGYAGDFEIIDRIYRQHVSSERGLSAWDRYFHATPAARAVRNRKNYFHALLDRLAAGGRPARVLNLASGPGRCMAEWLHANPHAAVAFSCVELDPAAIAHAQELVRGHESRVQFSQKNIVHFQPDGEFDLIWAAGICDYFSEALMTRLLRRLMPFVQPGGELVVGNFCESNPNRYYMEILGDWRLHHRSDATLRRLAHAAGAAPEHVTIGKEPEAVNLFLHVARPLGAS